jgi:ubiquitin-conjugating enzyme E2 I
LASWPSPRPRRTGEDEFEFFPLRRSIECPSETSTSLALFSLNSITPPPPPPLPSPPQQQNNNNTQTHTHTQKHHSSVDLCKWDCRLPGKEGTAWAGGSFPLSLEFSADDYPAKPPKARFPAGFFHPNVYPSGTVCLSILNEDEGWRPSLTVRNVLLGVQELLADPNPKSPAQSDAYVLFVKEPAEYTRRVRAQTAKYPPPS